MKIVLRNGKVFALHSDEQNIKSSYGEEYEIIQTQVLVNIGDLDPRSDDSLPEVTRIGIKKSTLLYQYQAKISETQVWNGYPVPMTTEFRDGMDQRVLMVERNEWQDNVDAVIFGDGQRVKLTAAQVLGIKDVMISHARDSGTWYDEQLTIITGE